MDAAKMLLMNEIRKRAMEFKAIEDAQFGAELKAQGKSSREAEAEVSERSKSKKSSPYLKSAWRELVAVEKVVDKLAETSHPV